MAKLKHALARFQARTAQAESKAKKMKHESVVREQKRAAQAARTRAKQSIRPPWLPFDGLPTETCIVLIGEGDFSFAASFVKKYPLNRVIATSLDSEAEISEKYPSTAPAHIAALHESGHEVLHGVDATQLQKCRVVKTVAAHESNDMMVVFNFPHLGNSVADQDRNIRQHQELLLAFFKQCDAMHISRVVVTLFDGMPYEAWQPKQLARSARYGLVRTGRFPWSEFPEYTHQLTSKSGGKTHKQQSQRDARIYLWESQNGKSGSRKGEAGSRDGRDSRDDSDSD